MANETISVNILHSTIHFPDAFDIEILGAIRKSMDQLSIVR